MNEQNENGQEPKVTKLNVGPGINEATRILREMIKSGSINLDSDQIQKALQADLGNNPRHNYFFVKLAEIGMFDSDSDYAGYAGQCLLEISALLSIQHHTGEMYQLVMSLMNYLNYCWNNLDQVEARKYFKDFPEPDSTQTKENHLRAREIKKKIISNTDPQIKDTMIIAELENLEQLAYHSQMKPIEKYRKQLDILKTYRDE